MSLKAKPKNTALRKSPLVKASKQSCQLPTLTPHHCATGRSPHGWLAASVLASSAAVTITAPTEPPETLEIANKRLRISFSVRPWSLALSIRRPMTLDKKKPARLAPPELAPMIGRGQAAPVLLQFSCIHRSTAASSDILLVSAVPPAADLASIRRTE